GGGRRSGRSGPTAGFAYAPNLVVAEKRWKVFASVVYSMAITENDSGTDRTYPQGFSEALKTSREALSSALHTRLELFVTELEEERERFKQTLLLTLLAVFGFSLGFILLIIFIVVLFLVEGWIIALGCLAFLFL